MSGEGLLSLRFPKTVRVPHAQLRVPTNLNNEEGAIDDRNQSLLKYSDTYLLMEQAGVLA